MDKVQEQAIVRFLRNYDPSRKLTLTTAAEKLGVTRYKIQKVANKHKIQLAFKGMEASAIAVVAGTSNVSMASQSSDPADLTVAQQSLIRTNLHMSLSRLAQVTDSSEAQVQGYLDSNALHLYPKRTTVTVGEMQERYDSWFASLSPESQISLSNSTVALDMQKASSSEVKVSRIVTLWDGLPEDRKQYFRDNLTMSWESLTKELGVSINVLTYGLKKEGLKKGRPTPVRPQRKPSSRSFVSWGSTTEGIRRNATNNADRRKLSNEDRLLPSTQEQRDEAYNARKKEELARKEGAALLSKTKIRQRSRTGGLTKEQQAYVVKNAPTMTINALRAALGVHTYQVTNFCEAQGIVPYKRVRVTLKDNPESQEFVRKYVSKMSLSDIARTLNVQVTVVREFLEEEGITERWGGYSRISKEQKQYIKENEFGLSLSELASGTGLEESVVREYLKKRKDKADRLAVARASKQKAKGTASQQASAFTSDKKEVIRLSAGLRTATDLATELGVRASTIRRYATKEGIELKKDKGGKRKSRDYTKTPTASNSDKAFILENYTTLPYSVLATRTGLTVHKVKMVLKTAGLDIASLKQQGKIADGRGLRKVKDKGKSFKLALCTGRYQNFTKSHADNIVLASQLAEKVVIVIGSAQLSGTERNPFHVDLRRQVIEGFVGSLKGLTAEIVVMELADLSTEDDISPDWGAYLLQAVIGVTNQKPDLVIHGDDGRPNDPVNWFSETDKTGLHFLMIPRNAESLSGTKSRRLIVEGKLKEWQDSVPASTHQFYDKYREELLKCDFYRLMLEEPKL